MINYRAHNGYDTKKASEDATVTTTGESKTIQSFTEDADINVIMERYGVTGQIPLNPRVPMYGDFTGVTDYQTSMNAIIAAQQGFMELPARIRARFDNNPQKLLEFIADDNNEPEAITLGLVSQTRIQEIANAKAERTKTEAGKAADTPKPST